MSRKHVYVPRFGAHLGSSQRDEPEQEQAHLSYCNVTQGQKEKCGNKRAKGERTRSLLKIKLPNFRNRSSTKEVSKEDKTPRRWTSEPTRTTAETTVRRGEQTNCNIAFTIIAS